MECLREEAEKSMAAVLGRWRATYTPGDWVVLSGPTSLVLLEPPTHEWAPLINTLWDQVVASSSITELAARLASFKIDELPSFGAFFWTPDGMRSLVRGRISVIDLATGKLVADGEGIQTWTEVGLAGVSHIRVDTPYDGDATLLELPLVVGAVRASSVVLDASEREQVRSPQGQPMLADAPGPALSTEPLPHVIAAPSTEAPQQPAPEAVAAATPTDQTAELSSEEIAALQRADTELMPSPFDEPESEAEPGVQAPEVPLAPSSGVPCSCRSNVWPLPGRQSPGFGDPGCAVPGRTRKPSKFHELSGMWKPSGEPAAAVCPGPSDRRAARLGRLHR